MARLEWHDTTNREPSEDESRCRAVGCRSRQDLYVVTSDDMYEDVVCLFHMAAYVMEFIYLTGDGIHVAWNATRIITQEEHDRLAALSEWDRKKHPAPPYITPLNGPSGDMTHLLGTISIATDE